MPVGFWPLEGFGDEDAVNVAKARYQAAYFAEFKGIWCKFRSLFMGIVAEREFRSRRSRHPDTFKARKRRRFSYAWKK